MVRQSNRSLSRAWRWLGWRILFVLIAFSCGFGAFLLGVDVTDREGVATADLLTKGYYTLGLFVLGGLDLGTPVGGTEFGRGLLWFAYFLCPAVTASAVIEGTIRLMNPQEWALRRVRRHVVIGGGGRLAMLYLQALRERDPGRTVVVVEAKVDSPMLDDARERYRAHVVHGDVSSSLVLDSVRLQHAEMVLLLTGNDFENLEATAKILDGHPHLRGKIVLHVSDITMRRLLPESHVLDHAEIFNSHQVAARHLVESRLLDHFERTKPRDVVVLAGFGRFGQTVLSELQDMAGQAIRTVIIIDTHAARNVALFQEQVGFNPHYRLEILEKDMGDPRVWSDVQNCMDPEDHEPVFVLGSSDDGNNIRVAMWLSQRFPSAYTVALSFRQSVFVQRISDRSPFDVVSAADLVAASIPDSWFP